MLLGSNIIYRIPETGEAAAAKIIKVHDREWVDLVFWRSSETELRESVKLGYEPGQWQHTMCLQHDKHGRPVYEEEKSQ